MRIPMVLVDLTNENGGDGSQLSFHSTQSRRSVQENERKQHPRPGEHPCFSLSRPPSKSSHGTPIDPPFSEKFKNQQPQAVASQPEQKRPRRPSRSSDAHRPLPNHAATTSVTSKKKAHRNRDGSRAGTSVDTKNHLFESIVPTRKRQSSGEMKRAFDSDDEDSPDSQSQENFSQSLKKLESSQHSDSDLELPYEQDLGQSNCFDLSEKSNEPLRPGDVIMYCSPMFVAGRSDGIRIAQVWNTEPDREFPLVLSSNEFLPADHQVKRIKELYKGELIRHPGMFRPIQNFRMSNAAMSDKVAGNMAAFKKHVHALQDILASGNTSIENPPPQREPETRKPTPLVDCTIGNHEKLSTSSPSTPSSSSSSSAAKKSPSFSLSSTSTSSSRRRIRSTTPHFEANPHAMDAESIEFMQKPPLNTVAKFTLRGREYTNSMRSPACSKPMSSKQKTRIEETSQHEKNRRSLSSSTGKDDDNKKQEPSVDPAALAENDDKDNHPLGSTSKERLTVHARKGAFLDTDLPSSDSDDDEYDDTLALSGLHSSKRRGCVPYASRAIRSQERMKTIKDDASSVQISISFGNNNMPSLLEKPSHSQMSGNHEVTNAVYKVDFSSSDDSPTRFRERKKLREEKPHQPSVFRPVDLDRASPCRRTSDDEKRLSVRLSSMHDVALQLDDSGSISSIQNSSQGSSEKNDDQQQNSAEKYPWSRAHAYKGSIRYAMKYPGSTSRQLTLVENSRSASNSE